MKVFLRVCGRYFRFVSCLIFSLCLLLGTACGTYGGGGKITVVGRAFSAQITPGATQDVLAHCQTGEQLVGGGYSTEQPARPDEAVAVEASFPDKSVWHVTFFNPNNQLAASVVAIAFCLTSPTQVAGSIQMGNSPGYLPSPDVLNTFNVLCPAGNTLLSGGFRVDHRANEQVQNAGVVASKPHLDVNRQADGWSLTLVSYDTANPGTPLNATIYALCASSVLMPAPPVKGKSAPFSTPTPTPSPPAGTAQDSTPSCGTNRLTVGGGFELLFPRQTGTDHPYVFQKSVYNTETSADLTSWQAKAVSAGDPGLSLQAWAACILLPTT